MERRQGGIAVSGPPGGARTPCRGLEGLARRLPVLSDQGRPLIEAVGVEPDDGLSDGAVQP